MLGFFIGLGIGGLLLGAAWLRVRSSRNELVARVRAMGEGRLEGSTQASTGDPLSPLRSALDEATAYLLAAEYAAGALPTVGPVPTPVAEHLSAEPSFRSVIDAMEDPITVLAPDWEVLHANRAARRLFGSDVVGRPCYRAFRMRDEPCEDCPARRTLETGRSENVEHRIFGNAITRISTYPLRSPAGQVEAIINHKRDVTQERQLEDLKAGFLASVSHDLRTPLTSLVGFNKLNLQRIERQVVPAVQEAPRARRAIDKVVADMRVMAYEAERLGRLVNDLLDLSKLEAGKLELNMSPFDIATVVEAAIAATSALWKEKGIEVRAELAPDLPQVFADADRIAQVLINLIGNAIKFTEDGGVTLLVETRAQELLFRIKDTGRGIEPANLPHIFERFRMGGSGGGSGLGLAICRSLVRLHEGNISVESQPGVGSEFRFTVPRADVLSEEERARRSEKSLERL